MKKANSNKKNMSKSIIPYDELNNIGALYF